MPIFTELTQAQRHYVQTSRKSSPELYNTCENPLNKHTANTMPVFTKVTVTSTFLYTTHRVVYKRINNAANTGKIPLTPLSWYMSSSAQIFIKIVTV
jgi:hypothetical protein